MHYSFTAIPDSAVPAASNPLFDHVVGTYASETNKTVSLWLAFRDTHLTYRPQEHASTVEEILKHQLLSERRFFGEFLKTPEPPPGEVLPGRMTVHECAGRLTELAQSRLPFLAAQDSDWWVSIVPFFDTERQRIWVFWRRLLHTAHHRAQLTVYLRLLGEQVPPTYGPTADFTWTGADPTHSTDAAGRA